MPAFKLIWIGRLHKTYLSLDLLTWDAIFLEMLRFLIIQDKNEKVQLFDVF